MKFSHISTKAIIAICFTATLFSCTDLEEEVIDEVIGGKSSSPESAMAAAYGQLAEGTFTDHGNVFGLQEYPTDECMLPTRGSDWGDGGKWRALTEFTWGTNNAAVASTWNALNSGITKTLTAIESLEANPDYENYELFLAEARGLLALYVYNTIDLFQQAPYRDPFTENAELEFLQADAEIDNLIIEVESLIPDLANLGEQRTFNARFTKQAAYALLADMYLNRAVLKDRYNTSSSFNFTEAAVDNDGSDMDKVIYYTSLLIEGNFSLESNYFANFAIDNKNGSEIIFAVAQENDNIRRSDNDFAYMSTGRAQKPTPDNRGTNASCVEPEFYYTWEGNHDDPRFHRYYQYADGTWFMNDGTTGSVPAEDARPDTGGAWFHFNRGLQVGQQYGPTLDGEGGFDMTSDGRIAISKLMMEKNTTVPMDYTPDLNFDNSLSAVFSQDQINRGVRNFKWEFDPEYGNGTSAVDVPLYRLGGIYCMRAEAYFRNGETAAALQDINLLRTSRTREALFNNEPGKAISSLDEETLYNEIGFEMYWEMYRRKQMIRFGTYDEAYTAKAATEPYLRVFAIPQETIDVTAEITQNMGY
ncbi:RagB/SusD family nutrient uptake outer membrane protein [Zunongwangia endophytica]|uniref:RagB/SusD family nutrient uptake outer membrane protein n=1 Tax=Zunongwangia endophytica TaxID=1808945 RepID=A0ABV8HA11_9FLAO|nr:RagB/SusD family nutrient uptake outer membrane protein [Zunongwangia endophytica]MDN3593735.1 RagB/SusD family nutrient uptake outer membrane protein [Zunongwangia endophytica]